MRESRVNNDEFITGIFVSLSRGRLFARWRHNAAFTVATCLFYWKVSATYDCVKTGRVCRLTNIPAISAAEIGQSVVLTPKSFISRR